MFICVTCSQAAEKKALHHNRIKKNKNNLEQHMGTAERKPSEEMEPHLVFFLLIYGLHTVRKDFWLQLLFRKEKQNSNSTSQVQEAARN